MANRTIPKSEATKLLEPVAPEKAFYFYRGIEQPLGNSSRSVIEFAEMVKTVDPASVQFHLERGDFENWFKMLGDKPIVNQLAMLRKKNNTPARDLGPAVSMAVRQRVSQLQKAASSK